MGGTKIEILVLDDQGNEMLRKRILTPKEDYQAILNAITFLVHESEEKLNLKCSIGIGTPGSLSPESSLLRNSNSICLNRKPVKQDLEKLLNREIRITNDANCFALSEAVDGAAKETKIVFGVIIGTGVGAGIVIDKKVLVGCNAIAGEWGHNPLPWPVQEELNLTKCWCGQSGCIETFLSGPGLENDFERVTGNKLGAKEINSLSEKGDSLTEKVMRHYEDRMARSLAHIINILDPDVIVLGGGISNVKRLYKNVPKIWQQWIFSDCVNTKLVPPKYGDSSGVRGAAWLWE